MEMLFLFCSTESAPRLCSKLSYTLAKGSSSPSASWICGGSWIYGGHHAFPGNENTYFLFRSVVLWIAICTLISANSLMCQLFLNGLRSRKEEIKWCWDVKMKWLKNWHKTGEINYKSVIKNITEGRVTHSFAKEGLILNQEKEKATFNISHEVEANPNAALKMVFLLNEFPFSLSKWW